MRKAVCLMLLILMGALTLFAAAAAPVIVLDPNGGLWNGVETAQTVNSPVNLKESAQPSRNGYILAGWLDADLGDAPAYAMGYLSHFYLPDETVTADEELTLHALWIAEDAAERIVVFDTNADVEFYNFGGNRELERGLTVSCANHAHLERPGYVLSGWNTEADGSGLGFDPLAEVDAAETFPDDMMITLYAQWEQVSQSSDSVVFDAREALFSNETIYAVESASDAFTVPEVVKDGYVLSCWTPNADGSMTSDVLIPGDTVKLSNGGYYYPVWQLVTDQYWRFHVGDGRFAETPELDVEYTTYSETGDPAEVRAYEVRTDAAASAHTAALNAEALLRESMEKADYRFAGWNTRRDGSGTSYAAGAIPTDLPRVHLFAQWEEIPVEPEEPEIEKFNFAGTQMVLGNELDMQFAFLKGTLGEGDYVEFVKTSGHDGSTSSMIVPYEKWTTTGNYFLATYTGVAAKEMCDEIAATVYNAEGEVLSNPYSRSVRYYAMQSLNSANTAEDKKPVFVDMLNYGAAAQVRFGYNTDDLANNLLSDAQKAYATTAAACTDKKVAGENYYAWQLVLENSIKIQLAFQNLTPDMYAVVSFTDHNGNAVNERINGSEFAVAGNLQILTIDDVVLSDARTLFTLNIYTADGQLVDTHIDSVESMIARNSAANNTELFNAIMSFADGAYDFFH